MQLDETQAFLALLLQFIVSVKQRETGSRLHVDMYLALSSYFQQLVTSSSY